MSLFSYFKKNKSNILIIGAPKSGTTALYYRILDAMPQKTKAFFEPQNLLYVNNKLKWLNQSVTKVVVIKDIETSDYNNFSHKLLIPRDPRDTLVSSFIYESAYHSLWDKSEEQLKHFHKLLIKKSENPQSVSLTELWDQMASNTLTIEEFVNRINIIKDLKDSDSFAIIKYENFIANNFNSVESYLSLALKKDGNIPQEHLRVVRTKGSEGWRDWFTTEDVNVLKPIFEPYFKTFEYNFSDWSLNESPNIPQKTSSEYFIRLVNERRKISGYPNISFKS